MHNTIDRTPSDTQQREGPPTCVLTVIRIHVLGRVINNLAWVWEDTYISSPDAVKQPTIVKYTLLAGTSYDIIS